MIQDGNYPDFEAGQVAEFAVEFYLRAPELVDARRPAAIPIGDDCEYDIEASVVAVLDEAWVIDCGLLAFAEEHPPEGVAVGDWITGRALLGVDPFFYFERLARFDQMPALVYTWQIDGIWQQTAPFVRSGDRMIRDPDRLGWRQLQRTDAWRDDATYAEYRLDCVLLSEQRKRTSNTAT